MNILIEFDGEYWLAVEKTTQNCIPYDCSGSTLCQRTCWAHQDDNALCRALGRAMGYRQAAFKKVSTGGKK